MKLSFNALFAVILGLFVTSCYEGGVGRFDSVGGTYDENTSFRLDQQMYYEMYTQSLISDLSSRPGGVEGVRAFAGSSLSPIVKKVKISEGDMARYTMAEAVRGLPSYGDRPPTAGGFLQFKNREARVNTIKSPAFQVVGKMSKQRVAQSIKDLPALTKQQAISWAAEELEFQAIAGILQGCSPSGLKTTAEGGLGISQGVGSGVGAGVPLMMKNFFTQDSGFLTYTDYATHTLWNAAVNSAVDAIDTGTDDMFTLAAHQAVRAHLDDIPWESVQYNGKLYKAVAPCDPEIMWRLWALLGDSYKYAAARGDDNKVFRTNMMIELNEILYFSWPNLKKYRAEYNASNGYPDFGPVSAGVDPRTYSTTSKQAHVLYLGAEALCEGFNDSLSVTTHQEKHNGPEEVVVHLQECFMRTEWYAQDGRALTDATAVENRNSLDAIFYEPGVGKAS